MNSTIRNKVIIGVVTAAIISSEIIMACSIAALRKDYNNLEKKLSESTNVERGFSSSDSGQVINKGTENSVSEATKRLGSTSTSSTSTEVGNSTSKPASSSNVNFKLIMPVEGKISIDKGYSDNSPVFYPASKTWRAHEAVDIQAAIGTEVKAAFDGKITKVNLEDIIVDDSIDTGYGVSIEIDHGNGYKTVYANLSEDVKVKVGNVVKKGQVIGLVGDTSSREANSAEGDHLHFALLKYNKTTKTYNPVDPNKFIPKEEIKK